MPTKFPDAFDVFTDPTANTSMDASGYEHDLEHVDINDAVTAIEMRIGTTGSTDPNSLTFQVNDSLSRIDVLEGQVSTINSQITIISNDLVDLGNLVQSQGDNITNIINTKLSLSGGWMGGQLVVGYNAPPITATSYVTSQILITNTGAADNPPQLGFQAAGKLGFALFVDNLGMHAITHLGGQSLIIDNMGRLNGSSFAAGSIPGTCLVAGSVTNTQIAWGAVTGDKIANRTVTRNNLDDDLYAAVQAVCPTGTILPFGGWQPNGPPYGWLFCNGAAVSRTGFQKLFNWIGTIYGGGDGATTFNLPDMRGRVPIGTGEWTGAQWWTPIWAPQIGTVQVWPGWSWGEWNHVVSWDEGPNHSHTYYDPAHAHSVWDGGHAHAIYDPGHRHYVFPTDAQAQVGGARCQLMWSYGNACWTDIAGTGIATYGSGANVAIYGAGTGCWLGNAGGNMPHNNVQPSLGMMFIIKW
jgi:microcystin-dependent protein